MSDIEKILIDGRWQAASEDRSTFRANDPNRGEAIGPAFPVSGRADIERAIAAASAAAPALAASESADVAAFLEGYAEALEAKRETLIALAHAETALPADTRLAGELTRTTNQLQQAARAVRESSWTQPVIDTKAGIRAHYAPLGKPVAIFGPNNFPFAFNAISGSDLASAIAARNPVVAKAHPLHPATSQKLAECAFDALAASKLPAASVQMLYHFDTDLGLALAGDTRLGAVAFTGSRTGGLALKAAADKAGILFYAEMSSVNPVFMLPGALNARGTELAGELFASCTSASGQFCTNPGVVIVPADAAGDAFVAEAARQFGEDAPRVLFSGGVRDNVTRAVERLRSAGATVRVGAESDAGSTGYRYPSTLLEVDGATFLAGAEALQSEAFGPVCLVVRAADVDQMTQIAAAFEGNLTATLYRASEGSDDEAWQRVAAVLRPRVGRLIGDKMPTGVAVSPAMNHGGPYPATSHPGFTAVGMPAAIRRFAMLACYDNVPEALLPPDLRDANPSGIARNMDGEWTRADVG